DSTISMACRPIEPVAPSRATRFICSKCTAGTRLSDRPSGGLGETSAVPPDRAARPDPASSVAPVVIHYRDSLRPCLRTSIAPRRRATFRQTLLGLERRVLDVVLGGVFVRELVDHVGAVAVGVVD